MPLAAAAVERLATDFHAVQRETGMKMYMEMEMENVVKNFKLEMNLLWCHVCAKARGGGGREKETERSYKVSARDKATQSCLFSCVM